MSRVAKLFRRSSGDAHYSVSKAGIVLKIHLLDNTTLEFTLSPSDTGQAVLEKVGKVISVSEMQFYGLKFRTGLNHYRWLDREKPVREQLKRHADRSYADLLYFCVQYYVHDINLLPDDASRYLYYLQLKKLVLSRRLLCGLDQAIILASYAIQAEFGDHDREVHTVDFLSDFDLIPSDILVELDHEAIMRKVTELHQKNHGLSPEKAEICYIKQAQLLPTYGIEFFPAKDINNLGLLLGASFVGIVVRHANGLPPVSFRWADILNLRPKSGKSCGQLQIETPSEYIFFKMESQEMAHYVWQFFVLQHAFFRRVATLTKAIGPNTKSNRQEFLLDAPGTYQNGHDQSSRKIKRKLTITRIHGGKHRKDEHDGSQLRYTGHKEGQQVSVEDLSQETPLDMSHLHKLRVMPKLETQTVGAASSETSLDNNGDSNAPHQPRAGQHDDWVRGASQVKHVRASGGSEYAIVSKSNRGQAGEDAHSRDKSRSTSPGSLNSTEGERLPPPLIARTNTGSMSTSSRDGTSVTSTGTGNAASAENGAPEISTERHRKLREFREEDKVKRHSAAAVTAHGLWNQVLSASTERLFDGDENGDNPPKADPPSISPSSPRSEQCNLLLNHMRNGNIYEEFDDIYRKKEVSCQHARKAENIPRNRFRDISPYDESRVVLDKRGNEQGNDYVNASHVQVEVGQHELHYIAAQAPLSDTCPDFWQMIWEQDISIISMVTMKVESKREKCAAYWPDPEDDMEEEMMFGPFFKVTYLSAITEGKTVTRNLELVHMPSRKTRHIKHLQFQGWPDHGVPEHAQDFLDYLHTLRQLRSSSSSSPSLSRSATATATGAGAGSTAGVRGSSSPRGGHTSPMLVHCSAGIGRTGVTILLDLLVTAFEESQPIDIPGSLRGLRDQRAHFVQNAGQYKMVYETLIKYLGDDRLV
ncbi:tyrosine-protein phosphatase non-receptor type 21-like isoform X2 [Sycon ciliatum]|uniref:tyrosine-protein phosphatase non-receptor type 21-like isoform X2 n=1 Tax=Sycon ciliatum TaxID=27933 RepID=UPI0031F6A27B